jgi:hypothetical protein
MTSLVYRPISILLIVLQVFSTIPVHTYEGVHSLDELTQFGGDIDDDNLMDSDLLRAHELYTGGQSSLSVDTTIFESSSEMMGASYMIRESSRMTGQVGRHIITSDLLYDTMIRNMSRDSLDPSAMRVQPISHDQQIGIDPIVSSGATFDLSRSGSQLIRFEFGIPGNHLIFSRPVRLSVATPDIPDGELVDLRVHHTGDAEYNTSGLMVDPDGECLPDGTASRPASRAEVIGSQVSFYTCGASTFALGYVPSRDAPNSTVWALSPQTDGKVILGGAFTTV